MKFSTPAATAVALTATLGFPVYVDQVDERGRFVSFAVTGDGRYGDGGAEGDHVKGLRIEAALEGSYVCAAGVVGIDY